MIFNRLKREDMDQIVLTQIEQVRLLLAERGLGLQVSPSVVDTLAALGYDPAYGARPLKRTMQSAVLNPLATLLLEGKAKQDDLLVLERRKKSEVVKGGKEVVIYGHGAIGGSGGEEEGKGEMEDLILGGDVLVCRVEEGGHTPLVENHHHKHHVWVGGKKAKGKKVVVEEEKEEEDDNEHDDMDRGHRRHTAGGRAM